MSRPSRHHTVPQFYLRRWATPGSKQLRVLDKVTGRVFSASPRDVAVQREFYTDGSGSPELEERLALLEVRVAPIIKEIVKSESADGLTDGERAWLDLFLAVQLERTAGGRLRQAQMLRAVNHFTEALEKRGVDVSAVKAEFAPDDLRDAHLASVADVGKFLGPLNQLGLGVRIADGAARFSTSDDPLIFRNKLSEEEAERFKPPLTGPTRTIHASRLLRVTDRHTSAGTPGNLGITSPGIEIYLPLSPTVALAAVDKRVFSHERYPHYEGWSDTEVHRLRELALEGSLQYVYASNDDFELERDLLARNPAWADPERPRVNVYFMDKELVEASRRGDYDLPFPEGFTQRAE